MYSRILEFDNTNFKKLCGHRHPFLSGSFWAGSISLDGSFFHHTIFRRQFLVCFIACFFFLFPLIHFCSSYFLFSFFLPFSLILCLLFLHFYFSSLLFFSHICILLSLISSSLFLSIPLPAISPLGYFLF